MRPWARCFQCAEGGYSSRSYLELTTCEVLQSNMDVGFGYIGQGSVGYAVYIMTRHLEVNANIR